MVTTLGYAALRRQCEVAQPCPARYSEWVARTSFAVPSSGQRWDSSRHRQSSNCSFWLSQVCAAANCQASKARAWHTEGRWPRATPRRRVPSTSSAPLTLMEIRFWKVGQWGRIAVGNICAQVSLEKYKGHVCIIVNVASKWGKTDVNYKWVWLIQWEICFRNSSSADESLVCTQLGC